MSSFDFKNLLNLYIPYTFEEQLEKFANKEGRHIFDFRMKETTSEVGVKGAASFMLEGLPFMRVDPHSSLEIYPDTVIPKLPVLTKSTPLRAKGEISPHPSDKDRDYWTIKADFMLEHISGSWPRVSDGEGGLFQSDKLFIKIVAVPGYYLIVEEGVIVGYSAALEYALKSYFILNNKDKEDFDENVSKLRPEEFFGSTRDTALQGRYFNLHPTTADKDDDYAPGMGVFPIRSIAKGQRVETLIGSKFLNGIVVLHTFDSNLLNLSVRLSRKVDLAYTTEGGGTVTTQLSGSTIPPGVTVDKSQWFFKNRRLFGTGPASKTLLITFPPFNIERLVPISERGTWELSAPEEVQYRTRSELDKIVVSMAEESGSILNETQVTRIEPTIVKQLGLPLLKGRHRSPLFSDQSPTLISSTPSMVSNVGIAYTCSINDLSHRYLGFGLEIGPTSVQSKFSQYISPGRCIITDPAISVYVTPVFTSKDKGLYRKFTKDDITPRQVFSALFGKIPLTTQSIYPSYAASWVLNRPVVQRLLYKTSYKRSYESRSLLYKCKYKLNSVKTTRTLRYRSRWDSHRNRKRSLVYTTRFTTTLPEVVTKRSFYVFEWARANQITRSLRYATKWRSTLSRIKNLEYKLTWNTEPVDPVIVKPFFVKSYDPKTKVWTDKISFQVYGNSDYVSTHIANDDLWFYFSNPDKFEIVKFNYNLLPYSGIFLEELSDSTLDDREGVPENYKKIGNYTVKGINNINSVSLDVVGGGKQLNEARSYWIPIDINDWGLDNFDRFSDGTQNYVHKLDFRFRDDHHEDVVELDLIILNDEECCFTQKSSGSRCSPY